MPILNINGSIMREIPEVGDHVYIIENLILENLLFDRSCMGLDFTHAFEEASCYFLKHFEHELRYQGESLAELMIL